MCFEKVWLNKTRARELLTVKLSLVCTKLLHPCHIGSLMCFVQSIPWTILVAWDKAVQLTTACLVKLAVEKGICRQEIYDISQNETQIDMISFCNSSRNKSAIAKHTPCKYLNHEIPSINISTARFVPMHLQHKGDSFPIEVLTTLHDRRKITIQVPQFLIQNFKKSRK